MKNSDRLGDLAHRQLNHPLRDFAFVAAMIGMMLMSMAAVTRAATPLVASAQIQPTTKSCDAVVVRPLQRG